MRNVITTYLRADLCVFVCFFRVENLSFLWKQKKKIQPRVVDKQIIIPIKHCWTSVFLTYVFLFSFAHLSNNWHHKTTRRLGCFINTKQLFYHLFTNNGRGKRHYYSNSINLFLTAQRPVGSYFSLHSRFPFSFTIQSAVSKYLTNAVQWQSSSFIIFFYATLSVK